MKTGSFSQRPVLAKAQVSMEWLELNAEIFGLKWLCGYTQHCSGIPKDALAHIFGLIHQVPEQD